MVLIESEVLIRLASTGGTSEDPIWVEWIWEGANFFKKY